MNSVADNCPETIAIRAALIEAIADGQTTTIRYGRGSNPGTERTIQPLAFLDEDLFEGIQIAPEKRAHAQTYRSSCILNLRVGTKSIENPAAYDKCRGALEYSTRSEKLATELATIKSSPLLDLPYNIERERECHYLWNYSYDKPPILLKAPSDQAIAAFVARTNAVAIEDWGGGTWVVIDAMFQYQVNWPAWYRFGLHLERRIKAFTAAGNNIYEFDSEFRNDTLDWPGFLQLHPQSIATSRRKISPLYEALAHVPAPLMLSYIHDIRPQRTEYYRSQMPNFTDEQVGLLNEYGLAEKQTLDHMIESTSIEAMREVLELCKIPLPEMKSRRAPHIELVMSHAESHPEITIALRRKRHTQFFLPPTPLDWESLHDIRSQIIQMGRLLFEHLRGATECMPMAARILSH